MSVSFAWHCTTTRAIIWPTHKGRGIRRIWPRELLVRPKRRLRSHSPTSAKSPYARQVRFWYASLFRTLVLIMLCCGSNSLIVSYVIYFLLIDFITLALEHGNRVFSWEEIVKGEFLYTAGSNSRIRLIDARHKSAYSWKETLQLIWFVQKNNSKIIWRTRKLGIVAWLGIKSEVVG